MAMTTKRERVTSFQNWEAIRNRARMLWCLAGNWSWDLSDTFLQSIFWNATLGISRLTLMSSSSLSVCHARTYWLVPGITCGKLVHRVAMDHGSQSDVVLRVEKYIKKIEKHINAYDSSDNRSFYHFIFDIFSAIRNGKPPTFRGDKHCEAILAAFIL